MAMPTREGMVTIIRDQLTGTSGYLKKLVVKQVYNGLDCLEIGTNARTKEVKAAIGAVWRREDKMVVQAEKMTAALESLGYKFAAAPTSGYGEDKTEGDPTAPPPEKPGQDAPAGP